MLRIHLAVTAIVCTSQFVAARPEAEYQSLWQDWTEQHTKLYHPSQVNAKYEVFKANLDLIEAHNAEHAAGKHTFDLAINQFADLTHLEFARKHLGSLQKPSSPAAKPTTDASTEAVPDSIDWITRGAVTPVKNQAQCKSDWAFSATGAVEGAVQIATGNLTSLSEQELMMCSRDEPDNRPCMGGSMEDAFKYIMAIGDASEAAYPYNITDVQHQKCSPLAGHGGGIAKGVVIGYKLVPESEAALKAAVAQQPVSAAVQATGANFQFYHSGVFSASCGTQVDQGVLVVGYGSDSGKDYWKVKNSWTTKWGEAGYIRLARNVASKEGTCGITKSGVYPEVRA